MQHIVSKASVIEGWMSAGELEWLAQQAKNRHTIVEVGSWKGRSTKALAMATPGVVFAVDHWMGSQSERTTFQKDAVTLGPDGLFAVFKSNLAEEVRKGKVIPVRAESGEAISILTHLLQGRGGKADMVFIDADHLYESVSRDIRNYNTLLRPGGLMSGHDYSVGFAGVRRAVEELVPGWQIGHGGIWYATVP